jgi:hypothetical protein
MRRFRPSPAMVVACIALFVALGGVAAGAVIITSNSQVGRGTISGHKPPSGKHPNIIAGSVNGADVANDSLGGAKIVESRLGTVPNATHAANADALGGSLVVYPIALTPANGVIPVEASLGPSPLAVDAACRPTEVIFFNQGSDAGTLNWMFSQGTSSSTTVNASGNVVASAANNGNVAFSYGNSGRLEGQWIFSGGGGVTTVSLHAFQGQDNCEVRGTALWAPT